jgi:hypothetical protein
MTGWHWPLASVEQGGCLAQLVPARYFAGSASSTSTSNAAGATARSSQPGNDNETVALPAAASLGTRIAA